jgi:hypothetical protein
MTEIHYIPALFIRAIGLWSNSRSLRLVNRRQKPKMITMPFQKAAGPIVGVASSTNAAPFIVKE